MIPGIIAMTRAEATDPHFDNVSLLLTFNDQPDGSTTFTDQSKYARVPTVSGNAQIDTEAPIEGTGSLLLDGSGDYLSYTSDANLQLVNGDFTIEMTVKFGTSKSVNVLWAKRPTSNTSEGWGYVNNMNELNMQLFTGSSQAMLVQANYTFKSGTIYKIAFVRSGNKGYLFVDGVLVASATQTATPVVNTQLFRIGRDPTNTSRDFRGHIDMVRVTKGVARYTENYTPPTSFDTF